MFAAFSVLHGWVPAEFKMQTVPFGCVALAGVLPATLLLAWVSYRWVEQPCIRWGRSLAEAVPRLHPSLAADGSKLMGRIPT
jgi:peptidoglycan/LPS O-acetylase OafA/YrhL